MINWLILFSDTAAGSIRVIVSLFFITRLLSAKRPDQKNMTMTLAGTVMISIFFSLLLPMTGRADYVRRVLETVWITFCATRLQNAGVRMSLFVSIFYEITVALWQFLFAAWLGVAFHAPTFPSHGSVYGQAAVWLLHALLIVLTLYFCKYHTTESKETFRLASAIVLAGFLAVIALSEQTVLPIEEDTLGMWTILSMTLMMSVLLFNINRQYEMEKELAKLKSEQTELLERDYAALNNAYAINARLFHDFHNHIGVLRQLLSHQKTEEAIQYLNELQTPIQQMTDTVWSGDETVDYLINSKIHAAKTDGIRFHAQVEFPRHANIRNADLCAVLGNLLDNALEAAKQIPRQEERFISLTIRRINQMLIIKVENSFVTPPVHAGGSLQTTKENHGLHGWGLQSARTAAEKYDGTVQTSYAGNTFRAVVTLSFQGISVNHP